MKYIVNESLQETDPTNACKLKATIIANFSSCFENFPLAVAALSEVDIIVSFAVEQFLQLIDFV